MQTSRVRALQRRSSGAAAHRCADNPTGRVIAAGVSTTFTPLTHLTRVLTCRQTPFNPMTCADGWRQSNASTTMRAHRGVRELVDAGNNEADARRGVGLVQDLHLGCQGGGRDVAAGNVAIACRRGRRGLEGLPDTAPLSRKRSVHCIRCGFPAVTCEQAAAT